MHMPVSLPLPVSNPQVLPSEEESRKLRAAGPGQLSELETFMLHLTKVYHVAYQPESNSFL